MSLPNCFTAETQGATKLLPLDQEQLHHWLDGQPEATRAWVNANGFSAKPFSFCAVPNDDGSLAYVIYGVSETPGIWSLSKAPQALPLGVYALDCGWDDELKRTVALGWALGSYQFNRYKSTSESWSQLVWQDESESLLAQVSATARVRDLINLPPDDMMPPEMASEAKSLAEQYGARFSQLIGDELLTAHYPAIHAVGRASVHAPRLLKLEWGDEDKPLLALVGKGVCFDSGGLDLKPSSAMRFMQKDMGGAAHVLGLAELVMANRLNVRLEVWIPSVENAVAGNAFHPGDILETRKGISVEVDNTDAEGRLVLCDAIADACVKKPDLLIDFATLTGAARVAVGTEIACFFSSDEGLSAELTQAGAVLEDETWRLPLHRPYRSKLDSQAADIVNAASDGMGGAITAALFLEEFVDADVPWIHFDMMAWNTRSRPGRPLGGEAMGMRAMFEVLQTRYSG